ncbi:hypothetical protein ROA7450_01557 [Roseovarius albus]|uniref:Uncharacterized protein n=1 Tax=Roseovarius albus TaxID=1247867 RepID=A0A1X6YY37_9RHOB|nr:hypothetical protein [Roseovarius albus]SLN34507.1 hypothetical protein ROA7450_01557 [Roseovarius albus]
MKNPNSTFGAGVLPLTLDARRDISSDARKRPTPATEIRKRFYLCPGTNSVEPIRIRRGVLRND